jgi:hypothetical protein
MKKVKSVVTAMCIVGSICLSHAQQSNEVKMPSSTPTIEESYLNTVTSADVDGTKYKLIMVGDLLPKLYVNGRLINNNELNKYAEVIDKLTPILWQRQKQEAEKKNKAFVKTRDSIVNDLKNEPQFRKVNSIESFRLSEKEFIVNDSNQPFELFTRFKNKYIQSSDQVFFFNKTK